MLHELNFDTTSALNRDTWCSSCKLHFLSVCAGYKRSVIHACSNCALCKYVEQNSCIGPV